MEQHRPSYATGSARSARPDPDLSQPAELTERAEHAEHPDLADLAELAELLEGRVTSTTGFRVVVFALVGSVVLGAGLLAGAAVSPSSGPAPDNARPAQVFWGCVFVLGTVAAGWLVGRSRCRVTAEGITRIWGAKKVVVPWSDVTGFAPLALKRSGLLVLRRGRQPLRVPTPWHGEPHAVMAQRAGRANRALGIELGAAGHARSGTGRREHDVSDLSSLIEDPEALRILTGDALRSRNGLAVTLALFIPFCVVLPAILLALAMWSVDDTSRRAQVAWAVVLLACFVVWVVLLAGSGTTVRPDGIKVSVCFRSKLVRWREVSAFLPELYGVVILTVDRRKVATCVRLGSERGRVQSAPGAAYLDRAFGLGGVPMRVCIRCGRQFAESHQEGCTFHPSRPVHLGQVAPEGAGAERSWWTYPCCEAFVLAAVGDDGAELAPPASPGCVTGTHTAREWSCRTRTERVPEDLPG